MKPNIGISEEHLSETCHILNALVTDEFSLYARTRYCHWNVTGPAFTVLHKFFENQYEKIAEILDSVAERVRMLGGIAAGGNLNNITSSMRLAEAKEEPGAMKMVLALLNDHETIIREIRNSISSVNENGDAGTADFLTGIMEAHEKMAWMLRAHL